MNWQPITKEPMDAIDVLLFSNDENGGICIGFFCAACVWIDSSSGDEVFNATHWMPLPEPPK